jgi:hypothetical protein
VLGGSRVCAGGVRLPDALAITTFRPVFGRDTRGGCCGSGLGDVTAGDDVTAGAGSTSSIAIVAVSGSARRTAKPCVPNQATNPPCSAAEIATLQRTI